MNDLFGLPGVGKSKMVRKLLKKLNKRRKKLNKRRKKLNKRRKKIGLPKLKMIKVETSGYLMPPHISRHNVADLKGNPIDDRIIDGQANMPLPPEPLVDEDGDEHSPVWFLGRWLVARQEYFELHGKQLGAVTQDVVDAHTQALDTALAEVDLAEGHVNRLFPDYPGE